MLLRSVLFFRKLTPSNMTTTYYFASLCSRFNENWFRFLKVKFKKFQVSGVIATLQLFYSRHLLVATCNRKVKITEALSMVSNNTAVGIVGYSCIPDVGSKNIPTPWHRRPKSLRPQNSFFMHKVVDCQFCRNLAHGNPMLCTVLICHEPTKGDRFTDKSWWLSSIVTSGEKVDKKCLDACSASTVSIANHTACTTIC